MVDGRQEWRMGNRRLFKRSSRTWKKSCKYVVGSLWSWHQLNTPICPVNAHMHLTQPFIKHRIESEWTMKSFALLLQGPLVISYLEPLLTVVFIYERGVSLCSEKNACMYLYTVVQYGGWSERTKIFFWVLQFSVSLHYMIRTSPSHDPLTIKEKN